jgi:hypothetical protein
MTPCRAKIVTLGTPGSSQRRNGSMNRPVCAAEKALVEKALMVISQRQRGPQRRTISHPV